MDIGDVDGDTIERAGLKDKEFERFVKRLLKAERGFRHRPDAEVNGPVADYHGDDRRDLVFVVHGPPTLPRISQQVQAWGPAERRALLESIADIRRYDLDDYAELPELLQGLTALEQAAAPVNLRERVRAQFGTWHPGPWQINDPERPVQEHAADLELVRALLGDPESLQWALEWSAGSEAHRRRAMWAALGRSDRGSGVHMRLVQAVNAGFPGIALGEYLLGWAETETVETVETWLFGSPITKLPGVAKAALWFLVFQAPTDSRLDRHRGLRVRGLRRGGRVRDGPVVGRTFRRCLEHRVPIGAQHLVTKAALILVAAGQHELVTTSILAALDVNANGGSNIHIGHDLLTELLRDGHGEVLWPSLAEALLERGAAWQLANDRLLTHLPESTILDWVGYDRRRANIVAGLTNPHGEHLDPIVRELLIRFGPEGNVASQLRSRAFYIPGAVAGGLVNFERRQLENAKVWQRDSSLAVRVWALGIETILTERVNEHDARVELRAKYG